MRGAAETMAEIVLNTVIRGRTVSPRETSPHLLARLPLVASLLFAPSTVVFDPAGTSPSDDRGFPSDSSPIPLRSLFLPFASLRSTYVRPRLNGFLKIHLRRIYRYALLELIESRKGRRVLSYLSKSSLERALTLFVIIFDY